ncbi:MAG: SGNH/GDSL hydrolase family protein [Candidatus Latescibacteria bacterium]|jgi:lysophospholipase L1-like esterase|nr:SGNH/GDSL hydrolase family protein [Candidatus Latescibacterota bacterium]
MTWIDIFEAPVEIRGLPWVKENAPELWRLPASAEGQVRDPVWHHGRFPAGGRIRLSAATKALSVRLELEEFEPRSNMSHIGTRGLDAYVNGRYWNSVCADRPGAVELCFFDGANSSEKEIDIYLSLWQVVRVIAVGVDDSASVGMPRAFFREKPIVFYGSSIAQGISACRPGMTYPAQLSRQLDVDFVNFAVSGQGQAEAEVVSLICEVDSCCYVLDLGKSYGRQSGDAYRAMLATIREARPETPIVCVVPIYSTREWFDPDYGSLTRHTRAVVYESVEAFRRSGGEGLDLVNGLDLLGPEETDAYHEGVHPTDHGYRLIADRLRPTVESAISRGG